MQEGCAAIRGTAFLLIAGELFLAVLPLLFHYKLAACLDVNACGELLDICAAVAAADVVDGGGGRFSARACQLSSHRPIFGR